MDKLRQLFTRKLKPNEFVTPDGKIATLIENSKYYYVFKVPDKTGATFYNFNKRTDEKIVRHISMSSF